MPAADTQNPTASKRSRIAGWTLTALTASLLLLDGAMKLIKPAPVVEATVGLGYSEESIVPIGLLLIICTLVYDFPRTAVLGAILLTGYLGGAVAAHVRVDNPLPTHTLFPVYVGVAAWAGLSLRDPRVRALVPLRRGGVRSVSAMDHARRAT